MKLFKLYQTVNSGYNTYDSMVIAAETDTEAIEISMEYASKYEWVSNVGDIVVEYLGEAQPDIKVDVIISSFNAG
jgi:hypothetical protein